MTERCVVTGGAGVIGMTLVQQLVDDGRNVRVVDLQPRPEAMATGVDYVQGDLLDLGAEVIAGFDPHVVYHLAATFERSEELPGFWSENAHHNVAVSACVLDGAIRSPSLRRYVFASSYLIYHPALYLSDEPRTEAVTLEESAAIDPRNVTGAAKLLHEKEIELASQSPDHRFSWVAARIYRVYGPSSRDVVSRWIRAAVNSETINVYGDESTFDYVYSVDVAEGLRRLGEIDESGICNLATGRSRSVRELVETLRRHFPALDVEGPKPAVNYEASQASTARLREWTGWSPVTELERGVSELVTHERANAAAGTVSRRVLEPRQVNVLVTSVSRKVSIVKAIRAAQTALNVTGEVWGGDSDEFALTRSLVDHFWAMPSLDELTDDAIVAFCQRNEIGLLIPTRDGELQRFSAVRDALGRAGAHVPIGSAASIEMCNDKLAFAEHCVAAGLPSIPTTIDLAGVVGDRLVVKARFGAGGRNAGVDVDRTRAAALAAEIGEFVVQPYVPGDEYSVDLYIERSGDPLGAVARRRVRVVSGESAITSVVDDDDLRTLAIRAALALDVRGHAVVQVIRSAEGDVLLECNSRVGGASSAAWTAGLRSIDAMILEALGDRPPPMRDQSPLTMTRLTVDRFTWP
jgi:carbamoyl-phosphate synthase large subunit